MTDCVDPLGAALQELARVAAPEILARVIEDGQAEAKDLLQRRFVQHLIDEVGRSTTEPAPHERSTPAPFDTATQQGWYVYGVMSGVDPDAVTGWSGIEGVPIEAIVEGELMAVFSLVTGRPNVWGVGPDGEADLSLLAPRVHEHERVLEGLLAYGAVLPMRFGMLHRSGSAVRDMLIMHREPITSALARVEGRVEWGLTVRWDSGRARAALAESLGPVAMSARAPNSGTPGRSYLSRRSTERALAEQLEEVGHRISADLDASLREVAAAGVVHQITSRSADRHPAEPEAETLLKASYLVASDDSDRFREVIVDHLEAAGAVGLSGDLTGPWPPYNFAALELDEVRS
jgi:hypothetical protein